MAIVRRNILTDTASRDAFVKGIKLLKQEKVWSVDGLMPAPQNSLFWNAQWVGGQGSPVTTGPFAFNPATRTPFGSISKETPPNPSRSAKRTEVSVGRSA